MYKKNYSVGRTFNPAGLVLGRAIGCSCQGWRLSVTCGRPTVEDTGMHKHVHE